MNGHSTLEADSHFVCLDTHSLQNAADNIKRTQYFNLLTWCWEQMSNNRGERVLLVCDEAYLMIDPQVPQSLAFLRNVEKRSRKYESALAIISPTRWWTFWRRRSRCTGRPFGHSLLQKS